MIRIFLPVVHRVVTRKDQVVKPLCKQPSILKPSSKESFSGSLDVDLSGNASKKVGIEMK